jgi:ribosomal protein L19
MTAVWRARQLTFCGVERRRQVIHQSFVLRQEIADIAVEKRLQYQAAFSAKLPGLSKG